ncbi:MAG: ABC transporter substrate-binding protein [Elusimicrobiota bacterium]
MYKTLIIFLVFILTAVVNLGKAEDIYGSPKVVILSKSSLAPYAEALEGFESVCKADLRKYYIDVYGDRRSQLIQEVRGENPQLILVIGPDALNLIKNKIEDIPIVFAMVLNPANLLNGEYENVTGVSMNIPAELQLKTLLRFFPNIKKAGVVYDPSKTGFAMEEGELAAYRLGIKLVSEKVNSRKDVFEAWEKLFRDKIETLWVLPDTTVTTETSFKYLLLFSFRQKIPLIGISRKQVKDGALFAFSFDVFDLGKQAGAMANLLLAGRRINTITYEFPRRYKLVVNETTAQLLGLELPNNFRKEIDVLEK